MSTVLTSDSTTRPWPTSGQAHQQRHVQQLVVERLPVEELAMVPELLAVVGGDDHERAVEAAAAREAAQQASDLAVGVGEAAVVEVDDALAVGLAVAVLPGARDVVEGEADRGRRAAIDEAARVARRRAVGRVGVEVVEIERGRTASGGGQVAEGGARDGARVELARLDGVEARLLAARASARRRGC